MLKLAFRAVSKNTRTTCNQNVQKLCTEHYRALLRNQGSQGWKDKLYS